MRVVYLTYNDIVKINQRSIALFTPNEFSGVKIPGLLESAVHRPQQTLYGEDMHPTLYDKSAVLMHSLVKNHAFHNANKRTAYLSMIMFLSLNGVSLRVTQEEAINLTLGIATDRLRESDIALFIQQRSVHV